MFPTSVGGPDPQPEDWSISPFVESDMNESLWSSWSRMNGSFLLFSLFLYLQSNKVYSILMYRRVKNRFH